MVDVHRIGVVLVFRLQVGMITSLGVFLSSDFLSIMIMVMMDAAVA